ncbi:MAG: carboxylating nicotinate-nucleotide diphosphorylase [Candidatus Bathyarchaeia archaeon]
MPRKILEEKLRNMLAEDIGEGDITTALIVPAGATGEAEVRFKEPGIAAGIEESIVLLESLGLKIQASFRDGEEIEADAVIMKISGDARTILSVERTLLNLLSRMSGIATATGELVKKILKAKLKTRIACTRKTAPGLLYFDKKAVLLGGGDTHRLHLDDMILIKDNHIAMVGSLQDAVRSAKERASFSKKIEVEVTSAAAAVKAAQAGADIIMLDNFSPKKVEEAIGVLEKAGFLGRVLVEASGGITAENVLSYASKKVDIVSLGEITESPRALDINLKVARQKPSRGT